jgi:hypothetical protein
MQERTEDYIAEVLESDKVLEGLLEELNDE